MDSNKKLLQQLTAGKGAERKGFSLNIPGIEYLKGTFKKTSSKQVMDVALFSAGIYLMFRFGKTVA